MAPRSRKQRQLRTCLNCGDEFKAYRANSRFCGKECRVKFNNKKVLGLRREATVGEYVKLNTPYGCMTVKDGCGLEITIPNGFVGQLRSDGMVSFANGVVIVRVPDHWRAKTDPPKNMTGAGMSLTLAERNSLP